MTTTDACCSLGPYFKVHAGQLDAFKRLCERFTAQTRSEPKCMYYGFTFDGDRAHCREGYVDADGLLTHLVNVDSILKEALVIADITRLEVHGPADQLALLRGPLAGLNPEFFELEIGFRN
ncbi:MAG: putative quinol monooxygenase [Thiotrichales bacterium]